MVKIGWTGGIASGKSTVAGMLKEKGAVILDADEVAREVVLPGEPAWKEIVEWLGEEILKEDGSLDRKKLGQKVFFDPEALSRLNSIVHPRVSRRMEEQTRFLEENSNAEVLVQDIPLLIEGGLFRTVEVVLLVVVSPETQISRICRRDGIEYEDAQARLQAQMPLEKKQEFADFIIDNEGPLENTRQQVEEFWKWLFDRSQ